MNLQSGNVVGLLHPGEMGAAVGRCLTECRAHGAVCVGRQEWSVSPAGSGRRADRRRHAAEAGCRGGCDSGDLPAALSTRRRWAVHGFAGLDANSISPGTAREVAQLITANGGRYVDGGRRQKMHRDSRACRGARVTRAAWHLISGEPAGTECRRNWSPLSPGGASTDKGYLWSG